MPRVTQQERTRGLPRTLSCQHSRLIARMACLLPWLLWLCLLSSCLLMLLIANALRAFYVPGTELDSSLRYLSSIIHGSKA